MQVGGRDARAVRDVGQSPEYLVADLLGAVADAGSFVLSRRFNRCGHRERSPEYQGSEQADRPARGRASRSGGGIRSVRGQDGAAGQLLEVLVRYVESFADTVDVHGEALGVGGW